MSVIAEAGRTTFTAGDGTRLRVLESGSFDAPVTVVLVHGWTLSPHTWDRVVTGLPAAAGTTVRTVRFDLRGHGESDPAPAGTATIERCADDLAELIAERVPAGPIVLAGHSMGGMTAMALAERHPDLFESRIVGVALVASSGGDLEAPGLGLPGPVAAVGNRLEQGVQHKLAAARGKQVLKNSRMLRPGMRWLLFGDRPDPADVAAAADWFATCHPASVAGYRASLAEHERIGALGAFRSIPTVVLAGTRDRLTPCEHARRMAAALPDAQLLVYPGAGHMLPLERSDEVTERIAELVAAVPRQ
ncbi:alpha/beta fold hydrolase [Parasphingorhabdus pacifica]